MFADCGAVDNFLDAYTSTGNRINVHQHVPTLSTRAPKTAKCVNSR